MPPTAGMEIFQDLSIRGPAESRDLLKAKLISRCSPPWRHAPEREAKLEAFGGNKSEVLAFERVADDSLPAAGLTLWRQEDGYQITNIVPIEYGQLETGTYNALLQEFGTKIANPAAFDTGFQVQLTAAFQTIEDLLPEELAKKLRAFSLMANKSTGSSHPLDRKRWLSFLIGVHRAEVKLPPSTLARWLWEVEKWPVSEAQELAVEFEFGLELLTQADDEI